MTLRVVLVVGIAVALAGVSCSGSSDSEATGVIAKARNAMASRSFSIVSEFPSSDDPTILEYAPPDLVELSNSPGHDASNFNLIVGNRWYVSYNGERWLEEVALEHVGMVLGDPRVLLTYAKEPALQDGESLDGAEHHVVTMRVDASRLVEEVLRETVGRQSPEDEEGLIFWEELIDGLRLRLWIDVRTFAVSQLELDYPPFPQDPGHEPDDPPPSIVVFDFDAQVEVTANPISLPREDVDRIKDEVTEGSWIIRGAIQSYIDELGEHPPHADEETLAAFLSDLWPSNAITGERMRQRDSFSSGDFCYEPRPSEERYGFALYGWDAGMFSTIPGCGQEAELTPAVAEEAPEG